MTKQVYRPDRKKPDTEKTPEALLRELQYMRAEVAFLKKWNELETQERKKRLVVIGSVIMTPNRQLNFDPLVYKLAVFQAAYVNSGDGRDYSRIT